MDEVTILAAAEAEACAWAAASRRGPPPGAETARAAWAARAAARYRQGRRLGRRP